MKNKKSISVIISLLAAVVISILPPPEGLAPEAMRFLGIFVGGIILLITAVVDNWVAALLMGAALVLTKVTNLNGVFAQFSQSTPWSLVMIFAFAAGIVNSRLMVRIAYKILTVFPASYKGAVTALMAAGVITGPLIPSGTAKLNILIPVANQLTDTLGLEKGSSGARGLFAVNWLTCLIGSQTFTSGSAIVMILIGMMGADGEGWGMLTWFKAAILWYIILLIGTYIYSAIICQPKNEQKFTKEFFQEKCDELGPMSFNEKITAVVLIATIILWATVSITKFDSNMIGFVAICALTIAGVMGTSDMVTKVPWTLIIFVGIIMGMSSTMSTLGWNSWLAANLGGIAGMFTSSPWIFVPFLLVFTLLMRFIIIESVTLLVLMLAIFTPFMAPAGLNMFLIVWIVFQTSYVVYAPYQSSAWLGIIQMADRIEIKDARKTSIAYIVINFIATMASIPVWQILGLC